jgi:hypothetical protein
MLAVKATKIPRPTRCVHMLHVSLWRMNIWRGDSVSSMVPDEGVKQPRGWHGLTMDRARDCRYADAPSAELLSILPRCDTRCVCNDCARPTRAPRSSCISCSAIASLQPWNLSCRAVTWGGETRVDFSTDENLLWHHLKCSRFPQTCLAFFIDYIFDRIYIEWIEHIHFEYNTIFIDYTFSSRFRYWCGWSGIFDCVFYWIHFCLILIDFTSNTLNTFILNSENILHRVTKMKNNEQ